MSGNRRETRNGWETLRRVVGFLGLVLTFLMKIHYKVSPDFELDVEVRQRLRLLLVLDNLKNPLRILLVFVSYWIGTKILRNPIWGDSGLDMKDAQKTWSIQDPLSLCVWLNRWEDCSFSGEFEGDVLRLWLSWRIHQEETPDLM